MKNEPMRIPRELSDIEKKLVELEKESTAELRAGLVKCLQMTAENLVYIAARVRLLEDRGEDLSDLKIRSINLIRMIAHQQILPELVIQYQGSPGFLRRLCGLPIPEQKRLTNGNPIALATDAGDGGSNNHLLVKPENLNAADARQIFAADHIRDVPEQLAYIRQIKRRLPPPVKQPGIFLDKRRNGIVVSGDRVFISAADLAEKLRELAS